MSNIADPVRAPEEAIVFRKVSLRLLPFLFLLYVINLIDRTNIGIARLQMVDELGILNDQLHWRASLVVTRHRYRYRYQRILPELVRTARMRGSPGRADR